MVILAEKGDPKNHLIYPKNHLIHHTITVQRAKNNIAGVHDTNKEMLTDRDEIANEF